jgi:hypothetical protein
MSSLTLYHPLFVIARFMRATQLGHPDKPGDDGKRIER